MGIWGVTCCVGLRRHGGLFERVQGIREERRTRHPGRTVLRRPYPLVWLMRCVHCDSTFHGDAGYGYRRVRHTLRPACGPSATYRAERYEDQVAARFDGVSLTDADVRVVLDAMRAQVPRPAQPDPTELALSRGQLQHDLNDGKITLEAFTRSWRRLDRPDTQVEARPDELRLARARRALSDFGTLWRNPAVPDGLREEGIQEVFQRFDVDGPVIVAAHPQQNENAWLLGLVAVREHGCACNG